VHLGIEFLGLAYLAAGVHNGCVVSTSQMTANFFEAVFG
jgi:hypothetical protein